MSWGRVAEVAEVAEVWACRQNLTEVDSRAGLHLVIWFGPVRYGCGGLRAPAPAPACTAFLACVHIRRRFLSRVTPPSPSTTHLIIMAEQSPAWLDKGSGAAAPAPGPVADVAAADIAVSSAEAPAARTRGP